MFGYRSLTVEEFSPLGASTVTISGRVYDDHLVRDLEEIE